MVVVLCALACACAPAAQATPQFLLPATTIATGTPPGSAPYTELADVAMDAQGDTSILFGRLDPNTNNWRLMSTYRPAGGSFSAPEEISKTEIGQSDVDVARVAMNASGLSVATWDETINSKAIPMASIRPPGGDWETRQPLSLDPGFDAVPAVDDAGDVQVIFIGLINNNEYAVESAQRLAGSPLWSGAVALSPQPSAGGDSITEHSLFLAMNGEGDAVAGWHRTPNGGTPEAEAATRDAGGAWSAAKTLEVNPQSSYVPVSIDGHGEALAAPATSDGRVAIDVRPPHGTFSGSPTPISGTTASWQQLAEDAQGNAVAIWQRDPGSGMQTEAATRPPGGTFSLLQPLGPDDPSDLPVLAGDSLGGSIAAWAKTISTSGRELDAVGRPGLGAFGSLTPLFTTATTNDFLSRERAATGSSGDGVVAWQDLNVATHNDGVWIAPFDGAGPQLRGLSVPQSATAGQPAAFSVSPLDTWSSVASTTWSFGDGTTADGTQASHAYAAPGTYTVTASSTDSIGNQSTATRSIVVSPAPAAPATADTTPPSVTAVSLAHKRFRVGRAATAISARTKKAVPVGTAFRYTLSEAATVTFTIQRAYVGQRSGKRCVEARQAGAKRKRCTYYTRVGVLTRQRPSGKSVTPFSGRIGKRALRPGAYRVLIGATDAAGNASTPKRLAFTIARG